MANESEPFHSFIDTEAQDFFEEGRMVEKIKDYCRRTGQSIPESVGEIVRNVCESLALRYRYSRDCLELYADCRFRKLQLLGGGSRNELLCQSTADALGIMVAAGPVEASVTGNFIQQAIAAGMIQSMEEGLRIIERTWKCKTYHPNAVRENEWERIYKRMSPVFGWLPIVKGEGNERSSAKIQERT
jgi:rhamnulokinase